MTISMGPHSWHNRIITPQDAQKVRPARPQRVKARGVPSRHVEGLNDARTPLADFFSILLHRANRNEPLRLHAAEVGAHMATEYALRIEHNRPTRPSITGGTPGRRHHHIMLPTGEDPGPGPLTEGQRCCPWPILLQIFPIPQALAKKRVTPVEGFTCAFVCVTFVCVITTLLLV